MRRTQRSTATELGEKYRDTQTGIVGVAVARTEFQYGCERVTLETLVAGKVEEYVFDAPRLERVDTGQPVAFDPKPGGDHRPAPRTGLR